MAAEGAFNARMRRKWRCRQNVGDEIINAVRAEELMSNRAESRRAPTRIPCQKSGAAGKMAVVPGEKRFRPARALGGV